MAIRFDCPACGKRTQAPEELAGKRARCPLCQKVITVPEPGEVEEAPLAEAAPPRPSTRRSTEGDGDERRRPCPMCGELIREEAVRCRYCGEELDESGPRPRRRRRSRSNADSDLSAGDWVLAILCSGIGCIVGIVWMIQGKPKGTKMFGVSLAMQVVWGIVRFAIEAAIHR
jgi:predicted RNA-binding Zn-ribbon protein involved in translation (DUF1610 family)